MHAQPSETLTPRCHGRQNEIQRILHHLDRALSGTAAFVMVTGRPAVGKSTLVAEVLRQLRQQGILTLEGHCGSGLRSYGPLLEVARRGWEQLCAWGADDGLLEPIEQLFDLLHTRLHETPGNPTGRRIQLFQRMATLLSTLAARQPTVVVIHDLDLADPPTLQLLGYLGRTLTPRPELALEKFQGLLLATAQQTPVELLELERAGAMTLDQVPLDGLDADGVRSYLASEDVVRRVLELTSGDPRVLEALTRQVPEAPPMPESSASETRLLEVLAVFGRPLGAETLRLLTELPLSELSQCIAALTRRGMVHKQVADGELRIGFTRASDQAAMLDGLAPARRRTLHGEAGAYLERLGESELEACATHLLQSSRKKHAVDVALEAGRRLELSLCFERAADLYERAVTLATGEMSLTLAERLCDVYQATGQLDRALEQAIRCRDAKPGDLELALRVIDLHLLRRDPAQAHLELQQLSGSTDAAVQTLIARTHYMRGERELARGAALSALRSDAISLPVRLSVQNTLGKLLLEERDEAGARALFADNLERARSASLMEQVTLAMVQLGLIELEQERFDEAETWYRQALEQASASGEHRLRGACLQHLGVIAERRCAYGQALNLYQDAVNTWKQAWLRTYLAWVALDLGQLYVRLGHVERGRTMAELSERMADTEPPLRVRINRALLRGRIAARECHHGEAEVWFRQAEELAQTAGEQDRILESQLDLCELRLDQGRTAEVVQLLAAPWTGHGSLGLRRQLLRRLLILGRAQITLAQMAPARSVLVEALELADALPDPEAAWQSRYLLALVSRTEGREAETRRLLSRAAALEAGVRAQIPPELMDRVLEQPLRRGLAQALSQSGHEVKPRATVTAPRQTTTTFTSIVGRHARMQQVFAHVEKVAVTDALVLIRGESGTGKELVADAIHQRSRRAKKPLVKVNCAALVESLLLSELFGHERGAFTGAVERRKGRFELADGGTIFLDEIGDISPATQVALLRVLQQQEFERVGGTTSIRVNVRIICATNRDLEQQVAQGSFREDLYYRLRGFSIEMPPLRDRIEDLPLLVEHLVNQVARERNTAPRRMSDAAMRLLRRHTWPGNVRELENVLRSVSLLSDNLVLEVSDFADYPELGQTREETTAVETAQPSPYEQIRDSGMGLREFKKQLEYQCVVQALDEAQGSITGAARLLGVKRPRLSQMIKEHGITSPRVTQGAVS